MIFRTVQNLDTFFFRFVTIHAFDRQTERQMDRQTEFSSLDRVCIPYSAVKMQDNAGHKMRSRNCETSYRACSPEFTVYSRGIQQ